MDPNVAHEDKNVLLATPLDVQLLLSLTTMLDDRFLHSIQQKYAARS